MRYGWGLRCVGNPLHATPRWCYSGAMKRFGMRIPDDLHQQITEAAENDDRSLNTWLLLAARHYLNHTAKTTMPKEQQ